MAVRPGAVESLELKAPDGRVCVRIHLREGGPDVEIEAANLSVAAKGALQLTAKDVSIAASGDFNLHAVGDGLCAGVTVNDFTEGRVVVCVFVHSFSG